MGILFHINLNKMKKLILLLLFIPIVSFGQSKEQLEEINSRGLNIKTLEDIWGNLNLEDGDAYSYQDLKRGNYEDNKYLLEVYVFYAAKLSAGAKDNTTFYMKLSSEKRKEFLTYFVKKINKETLLMWERKKWTYSKILIENIDLWEYIVKF